MVITCPVRTPKGLRDCLVYSGPEKDYVLCRVVCKWDLADSEFCIDGATRMGNGRAECVKCTLVPVQYSPKEKLHVIQKLAEDVQQHFNIDDTRHFETSWELGENAREFLHYLTEEEQASVEQSFTEDPVG